MDLNHFCIDSIRNFECFTNVFISYNAEVIGCLVLLPNQHLLHHTPNYTSFYDLVLFLSMANQQVGIL